MFVAFVDVAARDATAVRAPDFVATRDDIAPPRPVFAALRVEFTWGVMVNVPARERVFDFWVRVGAALRADSVLERNTVVAIRD